MALPDPLPIPAELAVDDEPFDDDALDTAIGYLSRSDEEQAQLAPTLRAEVVRAGLFRIDDDQLAEWAMRKIAAYVADENEAADRAAEWHRRIDVWFADHVAALARRSDFLRVRLEQYALDRRAADPRAKTTKLPSGVVKTIHHREAIEIVDADAVLEWADLAAPQIITKSVKVTDLRTVAEIVQVVVGATIATTFDCGHATIEHRQADEAAVTALLASGPVDASHGQSGTCTECSDGLGEISRLVTDQHVEPWFANVAGVVTDEAKGTVDSVPGTMVKPPHVTAKVVPS